tara:strand:+ start:556 stop:924 length:369 start_codon:yes stop_codon:yes gene_type:complete
MTPVNPLGHHVLIEVIEVQFKSKGGIILGTEQQESREKKGRDIGIIKAFGPTAYKGFSGCESPEDWGVKIGDIVELSGRYDGKHSTAQEYDKAHEGLRYVNDSDIIGVFGKELTNQLMNEVK